MRESRIISCPAVSAGYGAGQPGEGIYRSIDNFARVSKFGGGMGLYFEKSGQPEAASEDLKAPPEGLSAGLNW